MKVAVVHRSDQQLIVEDLPIFEPIPVDGFALHGRGETHVERQQIPLQDSTT